MTDDPQPGPTTHPRFNGEDLARLSAGGEGAADIAPTRQRCAVLGIDWLDEEPPVSADAVALIDAVMWSAMPLRKSRSILILSKVSISLCR